MEDAKPRVGRSATTNLVAAHGGKGGDGGLDLLGRTYRTNAFAGPRRTQVSTGSGPASPRPQPFNPGRYRLAEICLGRIQGAPNY